MIATHSVVESHCVRDILESKRCERRMVKTTLNKLFYLLPKFLEFLILKMLEDLWYACH